MTRRGTDTMIDIQTGQLHAAAQAGTTEWHGIVSELDWDSLPDLLVEIVVFRNPAAIESHHGKGHHGRDLARRVQRHAGLRVAATFGSATG
jgi:hypothetical protein